MGAVESGAQSGQQQAAQNGGGDQQQQQTTQTTQPFYHDFADAELKGYAELKGWKSAQDVVKSARESEKLIGVPADRVLKLPEKFDDPKALDPIYDRLGRPAKPEDYKLPVVEGGEEFAKHFTPVLHGLGLNQSQAERLATAWNGYMEGAVKAQEETAAQGRQVEWDALHKEWPGQAYDERMELARRGIRQFAVDEETAQSLEEILATKDEKGVEKPGNAKLVKLFAKIGEAIGESKFAGSESASQQSFGLTPATARAKKAELMADPEWAKKALIKGTAEAQRLDQLQRIENQGV